MVYFAANSDPEAIRAYLKVLQQSVSSDADVTNEFAGIVVYQDGGQGVIVPAAVFRASKIRHEKEGISKSYTMTLSEIEDEIRACRSAIKSRPAFSRKAKLNLPELQKAQKEILCKAA